MFTVLLCIDILILQYKYVEILVYVHMMITIILHFFRSMPTVY